MRYNYLVGIMLLSATTFSLSQNDKETQNEQEVVKNIIQTSYVEGLANEGDMDKIDQGFHPKFILIGQGDGQDAWTLTIDTWKEYKEQDKKSGKLPTKKGEKVSAKFLSIDIVEKVAVVKLELYVGKILKYVDFLTLYKFDNDWKIISKTYYQYPDSNL